MQDGDIITTINDVAVRSTQDVMDTLSRNQVLHVTVRRDSRTIILRIVAEEVVHWYVTKIMLLQVFDCGLCYTCRFALSCLAGCHVLYPRSVVSGRVFEAGIQKSIWRNKAWIDLKKWKSISEQIGYNLHLLLSTTKESMQFYTLTRVTVTKFILS